MVYDRTASLKPMFASGQLGEASSWTKRRACANGKAVVPAADPAPAPGNTSHSYWQKGSYGFTEIRHTSSHGIPSASSR